MDALRVMVFIDASNLLSQLSKEINIKFDSRRPTPPVITLADNIISSIYNMIKCQLPPSNRFLVRRYWFASYVGGDDFEVNYREILRSHRIEPYIFKSKHGSKAEKGVDIALAKEMLVNAFNDNYDVGVLVSGDEDYVGLVSEVKRYGQLIYGGFFSKGYNKNLYLCLDGSIKINLDLKFHEGLIAKIRDTAKQEK